MIEGQECITIQGPDLSPSAVVEVQDFYARRFLAQCQPATPERRRSMRLKFRRRAWVRVWPVNDVEYRTTRDVTLASWTPTGSVTCADKA